MQKVKIWREKAILNESPYMIIGVINFNTDEYADLF